MRVGWAGTGGEEQQQAERGVKISPSAWRMLFDRINQLHTSAAQPGDTPHRADQAAEPLTLVLRVSSLLGNRWTLHGPGKPQTLHGPLKPWTLHRQSGSTGHSHCPWLHGSGGDIAGSRPPSDTVLGGHSPSPHSPLLAGKGGLVSVRHCIATSDPSRVGPGDERRPRAAPKGPTSLADSP